MSFEQKAVHIGGLAEGILIHSGETPIAHIGHAVGLPMWTNGGDIAITWGKNRDRIFRT